MKMMTRYDNEYQLIVQVYEQKANGCKVLNTIIALRLDGIHQRERNLTTKSEQLELSSKSYTLVVRKKNGEKKNLPQCNEDSRMQ